MPKCKNDSTKSYKGNEPSPKGLGFCAHAMELGNKKRGLDGNMWMVHETNKGTKRWIKIIKQTKKYSGSKTSKLIKKSIKKPNKKSSSKNKRKQIDLEAAYGMKVIKKFDWKTWTSNLSKNDKNIINKILTDIKNDLEIKGMTFIIVPLPRSDSGYFFIDYVWSYTIRELDIDESIIGNIPRNIVMMVVKLENGKLFTEPDILISFQHVLTKKNSNLVYDIFYKYLKNHLVWNKSPSRAIIIT